MCFFDRSSLSHRRIVHLRWLLGRLQLKDDRAQTVVAAADGYARLADPVSIIKQFIAGTVCQSKYILIQRLPRLITKPLRLCVIRMEHLSLFQHRAGAQSAHTILFCQFFIQCLLPYGDLSLVHRIFPICMHIPHAFLLSSYVLCFSLSISVPSWRSDELRSRKHLRKQTVSDKIRVQRAVWKQRKSCCFHTAFFRSRRKGELYVSNRRNCFIPTDPGTCQ